MNIAESLRYARRQARVQLLRYPAIGRPLWRTYCRLFPSEILVHRGVVADGREQAFSAIYSTNEWNSPESRSGDGSTRTATAGLRRRLPVLCHQLGTRTILDAPCGDFNWMRHVEFPDGVTYIGADIVPEMIASLAANHADATHSFQVCDIVDGPLPEADLWLCRDALFHLPNADVATVLRRFRDGNIAYLLTSNFDFARRNLDIEPGAFRYINLRRAPFNLPAPLRLIDEEDVVGVPRMLALWSKDQIPRSL
jgi:hypothetical protein